MHSKERKIQIMKLRGAKCLRGTVLLPADKSISHRAAMLAAIASGSSVINNYAANEDCESTLRCLSPLGVEIVRTQNNVSIRGRGKRGLEAPAEPLDCGNSGTTLRL